MPTFLLLIILLIVIVVIKYGHFVNLYLILNYLDPIRVICYYKLTSNLLLFYRYCFKCVHTVKKTGKMTLVLMPICTKTLGKINFVKNVK